MESKFYFIKLAFSATLFLLVCVCGTMSPMHSVTLATGTIPGSIARLKLVFIENETDTLQFQPFHAGHSASGLSFPLSKLEFIECKPIELTQKDLFVVKCVKGSFATVFVQDGDCASGVAPEGYDGPFYVSMWLGYPQVATCAKVHPRYCVKTGTVGSVGLKIGKAGDYRLVAHENVIFMQ